MTRHRPAMLATVGVLAGLHAVVLVGPAVVLAVTADKGGVAGAHGAGLLAVSGVLGVAHGAVVWHRLHRWVQTSAQLVSVAIAALNGLAVLALAATSLLFVVLGGYAPTAAVLVNRGWPVVLIWALVQVVAIVLAEATRAGVMRWLRHGVRTEARG